MSAASQTPLRVCVAGASGRMGQMLVDAVRASGDCVLSGALDIAASPAIGLDAGAFGGQTTGVAITADLDLGLAGSQCLIDFTRPEGTLAHLQACVKHRVNAVIGTTGFTEAQKAQIAEASKSIAIMMAPNMSVGVNVTLKLLQMAAKAHGHGLRHRDHRSPPPPQGRCALSGTALKMGEVIAEAMGRDLKECAVYAREGVTGERDPSSPSALLPSGVATSWATTPCCLPALASASRSRTSPPAGPHMRRAALRAVRFLAGPQSTGHVRHVRRVGLAPVSHRRSARGLDGSQRAGRGAADQEF